MVSSPEQKTPLTSAGESTNGSKHPQKKPRPFFARKNRFLLTWHQELLACVGFVAALIALFATVYGYRNKPSPDWPDWLTLNSIIAIYLVLLKSCVLLVAAEGLGQLKWSWFASDTRPLQDIVRYDDATRGPWGAAKLMGRLRFKSLLASLGAFVTLLTLLVDPASQQIVHFDDCQISMRDLRASVPRTAKWSAGGNRVAPGYESLTPEVRKAIDAGVAGTFAPLQADCFTGNCTFASDYSSLGWSGFCNDITDELVRKNQTFVGRPANTTVWKAKYSIPGGISVTQTTNFSGVPYITYAGMGPAPSAISKPASSIAMDFILAGSGPRGIADPVTAQHWPDCDGPTDPTDDRAWRCRGYGAARCYIFPSTKTYRASVSAGRLNETVVDADNAWGSNDGILIHSLDTQCLLSSERAALEDLGYVFEPGRRWLAYNSTSENVNLDRPPIDTFPDSMMKRGCQYVYWNPSVNSIQSHMASAFDGHVRGIMAGVPNVDASQLKGPQALQTIYNFGDVSFARVNATVGNVTRALDNHVRMTGERGYSVAARGEVQEEKTCIRIRWGWMAYPATLVALALLFFVLVAIETSPRDGARGTWKSSPLALLYHGLADEKDAAAFLPGQVLERVEDMEAHARRSVVQLADSDSGRTFLEPR